MSFSPTPRFYAACHVGKAPEWFQSSEPEPVQIPPKPPEARYDATLSWEVAQRRNQDAHDVWVKQCNDAILAHDALVCAWQIGREAEWRVVMADALIQRMRGVQE
jgi:hypothetical protein